MQNGRRHKRYIVAGININSKIVFSNMTKIRDISIGGLSLKADRRFEIDRKYLITLEYENMIIQLEGIVVWSLLSGSIEARECEMIPVYTAGVRFKEDLSDRISDLINFMETCHSEQVYNQKDIMYNETVLADMPQSIRNCGAGR